MVSTALKVQRFYMETIDTCAPTVQMMFQTKWKGRESTVVLDVRKSV